MSAARRSRSCRISRRPAAASHVDLFGSMIPARLRISALDETDRQRILAIEWAEQADTRQARQVDAHPPSRSSSRRHERRDAAKAPGAPLSRAGNCTSNNRPNESAPGVPSHVAFEDRSLRSIQLVAGPGAYSQNRGAVWTKPSGTIGPASIGRAPVAAIDRVGAGGSSSRPDRQDTGPAAGIGGV